MSNGAELAIVLFRQHDPGMTLVIVAGLLEAKAKVEVEVTAVAAD